MTKKIIILGAGQNGKIIKNILQLSKHNQILGFLDDAKIGELILGPIQDFPRFIKDENYFFVSIGENDSRKKIFTELKSKGASFINAVHPTAVIEKNVKLGDNIMVGALTYLNINTVIGDNTFINNGCIIEHDNKIGNHCHLAPGVVTAGEVTIGDEVFIGVNSSIRDRIIVGRNSVIGAAANVVADTKPNSMYYGNPAKFIKLI